ncbi:hypothetical protein LFAB_03530 [Lactiplantibacillus fabifermentans T30PCM01]|uniref:Uncharacterized protein n=1 Tax=Lactiplantibacillus fabifermentans T30PCM01 TaxID=1400520 RepID=W6TCW9_9LACO|nr:hypothetical protein LFAB_03530 [Lactiplantibacillus fabifermentans T30PCM01]
MQVALVRLLFAGLTAPTSLKIGGLGPASK